MLQTRSLFDSLYNQNLSVGCEYWGGKTKYIKETHSKHHIQLMEQIPTHKNTHKIQYNRSQSWTSLLKQNVWQIMLSHDPFYKLLRTLLMTVSRQAVSTTIISDLNQLTWYIHRMQALPTLPILHVTSLTHKDMFLYVGNTKNFIFTILAFLIYSGTSFVLSCYHTHNNCN